MQKQKPDTNLTMVISSLECGGAERVFALLARGFAEAGYKVTAITLSDDKTDFYKLPSAVTRVNCNLKATSKNLYEAAVNNVRRVIAIRKAIVSTDPTIVISFMDRTNVLTIMSMVFSNIPVIVTEHADPVTLYCGYVWNKLRKLFYRFAKRIVSPTRGIDINFSFVPGNKRTIIPNPIVIDNKTAVKDAPNKQIIAIGRLAREKGFDLLITAFSKVHAKHPDWNLTILGEGNLRSDLDSLIKSCGLKNRVTMPGAVSDVDCHLEKSDIFVLPSRSEGFGNVIIEAMARGLPIISFDCPTGPRDIITDHHDGLLVSAEDVDEMAAAINNLIVDEFERTRLGNNALETAKRYDLDIIIKEWQNLISP